MRYNSKVLLASFMLMAGGAAMTYAQVDPETEAVATDSADWEQDVILSESIIVGKGVIDLEENRKTPVAVSTIYKQEIQDKAVGNVEFPEILKNTPSVYVSGQQGGFGDSKMFLRGFDQSNTAYLLNGQPINGMEDGNMYWSNWSSMTDVANVIQIQRGLGSSKLAISSVGGTVNIVTKATEKQQGGMARFVMGNDSYMKGTVAYDTGLKGKWGFSMLLDYWSGHRKFARGTAGQGQSYFFSVGYKPNDRHNLNFMIFGAPQWHDQNYATKSQSQWDRGAEGGFGKKYNNTYGFLNGEATNFRRNYYHKPVANLNWDWNINNDLSLSTVVYASLGRGGGTGNLGSSGNTVNLLNAGGEIDFDQIYANNLDDVNNGDGIGNNGGGFKNGAIRSSVNNHFWYGAVTNLNYNINEYFKVNVGADLRFYKGDHFRQVTNLLGLNGWQDTKGFDGATPFVATEVFEADPWSALFNNASEGQRVAYDNSEKINYQGGFGQFEFAMGGFSAFIQGAVSNQSYQKFDRWNYAGGEAESEKVSKIGYNAKGGLAYAFNEEHTVFGNAGFYSRQPFLDNVFVPNTVDLYEPEVDNEEITGFEVGYRFKTRTLQVNVNLYHTEWANRFETGASAQGPDFTNLFPNVTQVHKGIEADFFAKLSRKWTFRGYASYGDWQYDGFSRVLERNNDDFTLTEKEDKDFSGIYVPEAAQFTFGLGTAFEVVKGLSFDVDMNYYSNMYAVVDPITFDPLAQKQEQVSPFALLDAGVTYEFKFGKQAVRFRGNVKNAANTQYRITQDAFGYGWGIGRTYNAGIQYNF
ncbi:TonB-dependent receptor [Moheibacter sediminis]|uniref:Outer membrane receptor proteins, mostly Fe transport n=1 Tax=Moheibacter sediminis TaxID=1434700 RepID=A0A1W2CVG0_9FLAO|nr:TonB-dependent receptor plug domain-containing protein [Moheibacter sediminis]SMC88842.1 Outer membrane receptor proteins, mostly Fe transport [Moheibacter sediminis]